MKAEKGGRASRALRAQAEPVHEFSLQGEAKQKILVIPVRGIISSAPREGFIRTRPSMVQEIVSQTTDVIERMCIETAIELTGNNRAAAAEMLGLSRQSLYVKLHKFGIQDKAAEQ